MLIQNCNISTAVICQENIDKTDICIISKYDLRITFIHLLFEIQIPKVEIKTNCKNKEISNFAVKRNHVVLIAVVQIIQYIDCAHQRLKTEMHSPSQYVR